jgi:peptide/nickel transport system substrate-binding protein
MQSGPYLNTEYLGILVDTNTSGTENPLINKHLRKAISYGFDRIKMMRYLRNNIGTPGLYGMIPPGLPSFDTTKMNIFNYNPDLAKKHLEMSGIDPENISPITLETTPEYLDLCKYIQHQLNETGIRININVNTPAAIKELKAQSKLDFFRASWIADYPDAENFMSLFYSSNFTPNGPNYTHFYDPVFDFLYLLSLKTIDQQKRYQLLREMNNLIMEQAPVIILYYDQVLLFYQNEIKGITKNPINLLDLRRVKKS